MEAHLQVVVVPSIQGVELWWHMPRRDRLLTDTDGELTIVLVEEVHGGVVCHCLFVLALPVTPHHVAMYHRFGGLAGHYSQWCCHTGKGDDGSRGSMDWCV